MAIVAINTMQKFVGDMAACDARVARMAEAICYVDAGREERNVSFNARLEGVDTQMNNVRQMMDM
eukprot:8748037-Heterocapsa_arctica.AAC.1